jgi:hypothetical protein
MSVISVLPDSLSRRFNDLPPTLTVVQVAAFLQKKVPTIRRQIYRGTFQITVRQIEGGEQYILLADLVRFVTDGIPQVQPPIIKREARNPFGRHGKRGVGRPSHASKKAEATQNAGLTA